MLSRPGSLSPKKQLGDITNNKSAVSQENTLPHTDIMKSEESADHSNDSSVVPMESSPAVKGDVENEPEAGLPFETQKEKMDKVLLLKLLEKIHHNGSAFSFQTVIDQLKDILSQLQPEEKVKFKLEGVQQEGQVLTCEKKGAMKFYYLKVNGVKLKERLSGASIKRVFQPSDADLRAFLEAVSIKLPGKAWEVREELRKEFGVENKLASLFCTTPKAKKMASLTGRSIENAVNDSSSEDDTPLATVRRSGAGLPPTANQKLLEKKQKQIEKKEKEKQVTPKPKKQSSSKKEKASAAPAAGISKFLAAGSGVSGTPLPGGATGSTSSPFLTPQKRTEKRLNTAIQKLSDAWNKRDQKEFQVAATWAAKFLNNNQLDRIPDECQRFSVKRISDKEKDRELMKKLGSKEAKKEFREKMAEERKNLYRRMDNRLRQHFNQKIVEEDLLLSADSLSIPGEPVAVEGDRLQLFPDCLMITQFLSSLKKFVGFHQEMSAVELLNSLYAGRIGYMKGTANVLSAIMRTLLHDVEYKAYAHCNARLREFIIEENTVSELCRALLIGSTCTAPKEKKGHTEGTKDEISEEKEEENEEEAGESGRNMPSDDLDISQVEQAECDSLLSRFTADKEIWQLSAQDQLDILRLLLNRVLDLASFKEYIASSGLTEEARSTKNKVDTLSAQLEDWNQKLSEMPQYNEDDDISHLSRTQSRERTEMMRKRDNLEKKIDDGQDKMEELVEKLAVEKRVQALSKRIPPIGQDRHFRSYFWFPYDTADAGLWVQDLGTTACEKFYRKCQATGQSIHSSESENDEELQNPMDSVVETWFKITSLDALKSFVDALHKTGDREGELKTFLTKHMDEVVLSVEQSGKKRSGSVVPTKKRSDESASKDGEDDDEEKEEDEKGEKEENEEEKKEENEEEEEREEEAEHSEDPLDALKSSIVNLASDLSESYLTSIDAATFEAKIVSANDLQSLKRDFTELVDSINPKAIIQKMEMAVAKESGSYSWLILDRWKQRLSEAENASAVHLLRSYLDSRIDWKKSVVEQRCRSCGSVRSADSKISCEDCGMVVHFHCARPKLREKPNTWSCAECTRQRKMREVDEEVAMRELQKGKDTESEEDADGETEYEDDDEDRLPVNTSKASSGNPRRAAATRKRVIIDSDSEEEEEEEERPTRSRRKRAKDTSVDSDVAKECFFIFNKLKGSQRIYRTLLALNSIPVSKARKARQMSLSAIEEGLYDYESVSKFSSELNAFLLAARLYFEQHNERKLTELDEVVSILDLDVN